MKVQEMTREDFKSVPRRKNFMAPVPKFRSLVIIPTDEEHDSGYLCMEFVTVGKNDEPIVRMPGCSDVLNINGIGGYGIGEVAAFPVAIIFILWCLED